MNQQADAAPLCWLCAAPSVPDPVLGSDGYARCPQCAFIFQPLRHSSEHEAARYTEEYFASYAHRDGGRAAYDDTQQRRFEAGRRVEFVERYASGGSVLEIGAASGYFVEAATQAGFAATGIEPSQATADRASAAGRAVTGGTLSHTAALGRSYDAVCAWHVLEHLPEPITAMSQFRSLLTPGGLLFLELPNIGSVRATREGRRWGPLEPDNHVAHYAVSTVRTLLQAADLPIVDLHTVSFREYRPSSAVRRVAQSLYDGVRSDTLRRTHPWKHDLLRIVARAPAR